MAVGLYLANHNLQDETSGVTKKIYMQIIGMQQNGLDVKVNNLFCDNIVDKFIRRLPFFKNKYIKNIEKLLKEYKKIDFVYMRHDLCSIHLLRVLRKMRKRNIIIIYEFPTFPYDRNADTLRWKLSLLKDKMSRNYLQKYVDMAVNFSGYSEIYGMKCIQISNGIDLRTITPRKIKNKQKNQISFLGVALLTYWNGYDRLIKSIAEYNQEQERKYQIKFHIAGEGDALKDLKDLVKSLDLDDTVFFHGFISGEELEELYSEADIAVGTLSPSRKYKNHVMSTLKTKEYAAKGIPFIKADHDPVFDCHELPFVYNVDDDERMIDIKRILVWFENLINEYTQEEIQDHLRSFSEEYLTWKKQLSPVVAYVTNRIG